MKKKSLLLLVSAIMGFGLVGGTLATWAVTDNADPFDIGISPGKINTDAASLITLSWGSQKEMASVSNLNLGEVRKAGVLDLKAETAATEAVNGKLSYAVTGNETLSGKVNIAVYSGNITAAVYSNTATYAVNDYAFNGNALYKCKTAITTGEAFDSTKWNAVTPLSFTNGDSLIAIDSAFKTAANNLYSVFVYLGTMTQSEYDALKVAGAKVTARFDWGIGTDDVVSGAQVYFTGLSTPHVYAWNSADDTIKNAGWPGVEMTAAKFDNYYTYLVDTSKYDRVIFNNGNDVETPTLTVDANGFVDSTNHYNCVKTVGVASEGHINVEYENHNDTIEPEYWIMGKNMTVGGVAIDWDDNGKDDGVKLTGGLTDGSAVVEVVTTGNAELKFREATTNTWYSNGDDNFTLGQAGTYRLTFTPNGSIVISAEKLSA